MGDIIRGVDFTSGDLSRLSVEQRPSRLRAASRLGKSTMPELALVAKSATPEYTKEKVVMLFLSHYELTDEFDERPADVPVEELRESSVTAHRAMSELGPEDQKAAWDEICGIRNPKQELTGEEI